MKKIFFTILICGIMILGITGCGNMQKDISLSIKEGTLTNVGATLILKNNSNKKLMYSEVYEIDIKKDNIWQKIDADMFFNEPLLEVEPNESNELELKWEYAYGKLENGEYKIIKKVYFEGESKQEFYVSAEFTIE